MAGPPCPARPRPAVAPAMPLSSPPVGIASPVTGERPPPASGAPRLPLLRWALLTALLLAEVMAVSLSFDAAARREDPGWAGTVIVWSPSVLRWSVVVGGAAAALAAFFLGDTLRSAATSRYSSRAVAFWALGQLAAYAAFVLVTARVLAPEALEVALTPGQLAAWVGTGLLTVGCWAATVLPPRAWARLLWQARYVLLAAACLAAATSLTAAVSR